MNSFVRNSEELFRQLADINIRKSQVYKATSLTFTECIMISVGVSGFVSGQILIFIDEKLALILSSKMHENIAFAIVDDQVKDSVLEISKLIIANSFTSMYESGVSISFTSISLINGSNIQYYSEKQEIVCIPFELKEGKLLLCLQIPNLLKNIEGNK